MPEQKKLRVDIFANRMPSNAYGIMGVFRKQARKEGWTDDEIEEVFAEAKSGNYDHLIQTLMRRIE